MTTKKVGCISTLAKNLSAKNLDVFTLVASKSHSDDCMIWHCHQWSDFCGLFEYDFGWRLESAEHFEVYAEPSPFGVTVTLEELEEKGSWLKNYAIKKLKKDKNHNYKESIFLVSSGADTFIL